MSAHYRYCLAWLLCLATVGLGDEPHVSQTPTKAPQSVNEEVGKMSALEHLRLATGQLEAAGMTAEAARLREVTDQVNQRVVAERAELAKQIQELQDRSTQLRRLTGNPDKILCRCCFLELSSQAAAEFETIADPSCSLRDSTSLFTRAVCKNAEEAVRSLKESGQVTILASPQIIAEPGCMASYDSCGEFPILASGRDDQTHVNWIRFGVSCEVLPQLLDTGRIKLDFAPEISHLDFKNSVKVNGRMIPGMSTRRVNTQAELNLGESLVFRITSNAVSPVQEPPQAELNEVTQSAGVEPVTTVHGNNVTMFIVTPVAID